MTITSKGNSLVLSEKRVPDRAGLDGLICMTSVCSGFFLLHALICFYIHYCMGMVLLRLMQAIVLDVLKIQQDLWWVSAPVNDKRQLIKGLVLWEMYPSSR